MLTAKNVSTNKVSDYFVKGHLQKLNSRWYGKGAQELKLSGAVNNEEVFENICAGLSPDGSKKLSRRFLNPKNRRAATDFTFSAPKTVSLIALIAEDKEIIKAHQLAVEQTLDLIEEQYASTRATIGGTRQIFNTGNLVVAEFDHIESRELDPHLHTHALIMNMTQLHSGEWYSNFNDLIFKSKKLLGMYYQSRLAEKVQKLGYSIEHNDHGQFEIKGFKQQDKEEFSKRRLKILARVSQKSTWSEREKAWASTRTPKVNIEIEELKQKWVQEATALKIIFPKPRLRLDITVPSNSQQDLNQDFKDCESEENLIYTQYETFPRKNGQACLEVSKLPQINQWVSKPAHFLRSQFDDAEFLRSIAQNMEKIISTALEDIGVLDDNNQVFETNPFTFYKQEDTILIQRYDGTEILKDGKFTPETSQEDFENLQEFTLIAMEYIQESQSENLNRGMRR